MFRSGLCLGSGFVCAPPLLAGVMGCVCVCVRAPLVPRHSWLGCWGLCVFLCALRVHPATPGWGVRCGCVCLGSGFRCAPPLLAGLLRCVRACVRTLLVSPQSWRGCPVWVCVLGLGFWLRPATPGWGVGVCVCLCVRSACTPPLLAGVCGAGVCAWAVVLAAPRLSWLGCWGVCVCLCAHSACTTPLLARLCGVGACAGARVSAAPRHSWLGCWGVCVLVCARRLYPATPGLGVLLGCLCLGSGLGCARPLLAGVLGCACACVRAPLVPRHSWLGCAVWACVFGLGLWLRPAFCGWGVGVCVIVCTLRLYPLHLAGVCGVDVCAWARVSAAPRHSWLGRWGVCVLVCALCLYPATPGWGVRCWCVCLGCGFGCAPPFLAGVLGCVCVFVCALRLYHATPGSVVRCGCVCWGSGFGCAPQLLAGLLGCVCACVRAPLVPRHSWLGCVAWVFVLGLWFGLRPATPGWGVGMCVCLCARSACSPPLLAGVCVVGVCVWARVVAAPRLLWLGCWGVRDCVHAPLVPPTPCWGVRCGCVCLGSGFGCAPPLQAGVLGRMCALRLYPASAGWGVRPGCVCLGSGFGCAPPLLAGASGCVCACVRAALVPRHSWLECAVLGVCVWARVVAAPRLSWLGCWHVRICVRPPLVPRHSWPGGAVWVCVLGLGFRLRPATPGWGVGVCLCLCASSACTPSLLAEVCGVAVCAWAGVSAAPRHSWLGWWGVCACVRAPLVPRHSWLGCAVWVCVLRLGFRLRPATPRWGVGVCVCVCVLAPLVPRHSWLGCAVWVGVLGLWFPLRPATPRWGVGVCVCVCVLAPLVPRHSWLGCAVWVGVLGLWFPLRPATPGWGVGVCVCVIVCFLRLYPATPGWGVRWGCVCLGSGFGCAPPLLAGASGCVRVCVRSPLVPRHSWLGFVVCGFSVAWHLFLCRGSLRVVRPARVCGTWWPSLLGTCPCALVVSGGVPPWRAWWPRFGALRLVRSGRSRCFGPKNMTAPNGGAYSKPIMRRLCRGGG